MKYAQDDPAFADFVAALDPVNAAADASPGFVWRLASDAGDSPALAEFEGRGWLVNMSVWESLEDLTRFIRSPLHLAVMRRRAEWFEPTDVSLCLWWVPAGHRPGFEEAMARLEHLRAHGPTQHAFTFSEFYKHKDQ